MKNARLRRGFVYSLAILFLCISVITVILYGILVWNAQPRSAYLDYDALVSKQEAAKISLDTFFGPSTEYSAFVASSWLNSSGHSHFSNASCVLSQLQAVGVVATGSCPGEDFETVMLPNQSNSLMGWQYNFVGSLPGNADVMTGIDRFGAGRINSTHALFWADVTVNISSQGAANTSISRTYRVSNAVFTGGMSPDPFG